MTTIRPRQLIAFYEAGAGLGGFWLLLRGPLRLAPGHASWLVVLAAAIYFALLTAAGVLLARGVPLGRHLSVYAQWCQVPSIVTAAFTYVIFTPASLVLRSTSDGWLDFEAALAAQVSLFLHRPNVSGSVGVNLLPLLMIVLITRQGSTRHKEAGPALAA